jgi:hypothetical protein
MTDEELAAKALAKKIAHRARLNYLYANDPGYRERCRENSRAYAANRRAREKEARRLLLASGETPAPKSGKPPGRPRMADTEATLVAQK